MTMRMSETDAVANAHGTMTKMKVSARRGDDTTESGPGRPDAANTKTKSLLLLKSGFSFT